MDLVSEKIGDYLTDLTVEVLGAKERKREKGNGRTVVEPVGNHDA